MPFDKSWHDYNESLVERGRILMDIGFIKSWNKEIRKDYLITSRLDPLYELRFIQIRMLYLLLAKSTTTNQHLGRE